MSNHFISSVQSLALNARFHQLLAEANTLTREFQHNDSAINDIFFNCIISQRKILVNGKWINLQAGMSITVEVKTVKRRLIEFLLVPLLGGVSEGARER